MPGDHNFKLIEFDTFKMYYTTDDRGFTKSQINAKIVKSKQYITNEARLNVECYCATCGANNTKIECSHLVSVDWAQKNGMTELAWLPFNIILECHKCHLETECQDKLIRFKRMLERAPDGYYMQFKAFIELKVQSDFMGEAWLECFG